MNTQASVSLILGAGLLVGACATIKVAGEVRPHSPRFYAGTRLDLAAIDYDRDALDHYSSYNILPPRYPGADLLFSAAADTVLLPFEVIYTISEPALGRN